MYAHPVPASVAVAVSDFGSHECWPDRLRSGSFGKPARFKPCCVFRSMECAVYNPFLSTMLLAFEARKVIELRLVRLAWGGREGQDEMQSMVVEKVYAAMEAAWTLMMGGSAETVISRYREHVAANTKRLMAA